MTLSRFTLPALFLATLAASAVALTQKNTEFTLASSQIPNSGKLPAEFTCDGERASPPLYWENPPDGTKSFAIAMHHTPGPGDTHVYLLLYNIPASGGSIDKNSKNVGTFGVNTVNGKAEYSPPCSKGPGEKKYTITLYALSDTLKFDKPEVNLDTLLAAMKDKTIATSAMNVTYERQHAGNDRPQQGPGPGPDGHGRPNGGNDRPNGPPRGGPPELQRAYQSFKLTPEQQTKVDAALQAFREKQEATRNELLKQLKDVLSKEQFEKVESSFKRPVPPPQGGEGRGGQGQGGPPPGGPDLP